MKLDEITAKILGCSVSGYYKWKKQERPIISLLEKYFTKDDLAEFLETEKILKFDNILKIQNTVINNNIDKYIDAFVLKSPSNSLKYTTDYFIDFYFSFLINFNKFDTKKSFSCIILDYLIDYSSDKYEYSQEIKIINRYMYLFNDFDDLMTIFLTASIKNNLSELIDSIYLYDNLNKVKKDEAYFHVIGFYVYSNYSDLNTNLKVELIKNLSDRTRDQFFSFDMLINFINKTELETIEALKELNFDTPLYGYNKNLIHK